MIEQNKKLLIGHVSPETAFMIDDYPYGFKLRCKKRVWVETDKKGHQRYCEQTTNPKVKPEEYWNKPKKSTYQDLMFIERDDSNGYVKPRGAYLGSTQDCVEVWTVLKQRFGNRLEEALLPAQQKMIRRYYCWHCGIEAKYHPEMSDALLKNAILIKDAPFNELFDGDRKVYYKR